MNTNSNISQELLETIERYYNATMTGEERIGFEARLQQEPEFKTQVEDIKTLLFGIEEQALTEKLEEFHSDLPINMEAEKTDFRLRQLHYRQIAASVIILVASVSFWIFSGSSTELLYDDYFKPDPGLPTTMSSSDNFAFYDAMVHYKHGDYKKAIGKWEILHDKVPQNDTLNYFLGSAYLADKNEDKAISYLEDVTETQASAFKNEAYYYLGFAYLKKKNIASAKKNFKSSTFENSKTILSKLD